MYVAFAGRYMYEREFLRVAHTTEQARCDTQATFRIEMRMSCLLTINCLFDFQQQPVIFPGMPSSTKSEIFNFMLDRH
jgi:hypothetical protein